MGEWNVLPGNLAHDPQLAGAWPNHPHHKLEEGALAAAVRAHNARDTLGNIKVQIVKADYLAIPLGEHACGDYG